MSFSGGLGYRTVVVAVDGARYHPFVTISIAAAAFVTIRLGARCEWPSSKTELAILGQSIRERDGRAGDLICFFPRRGNLEFVRQEVEESANCWDHPSP